MILNKRAIDNMSRIVELRGNIADVIISAIAIKLYANQIEFTFLA